MEADAGLSGVRKTIGLFCQLKMKTCSKERVFIEVLGLARQAFQVGLCFRSPGLALDPDQIGD